MLCWKSELMKGVIMTIRKRWIVVALLAVCSMCLDRRPKLCLAESVGSPSLAITFQDGCGNDFCYERAVDGYILNKEQWLFNDSDSFKFADAPAESGWISLGEAISRDYKMSGRRQRGGNVWYKITTGAVPEEYEGKDVVLVFQTRFNVLGCSYRGQRCPNVSESNDYAKGTNKYFLIEDFKKGGSILVKIADFDYRFPNHVGKVVLKEAAACDIFECQLREMLSKDNQQNFIITTVANRGTKARTVELITEVQDFFGTPLRSESKTLGLTGGSSDSSVKLNRENFREYKVVAKLNYKGKASPEFWGYFAYAHMQSRDNQFRNNKLLMGGWSYHWVKSSESFENEFTDGWETVPGGDYPIHTKDGTLYIFGADHMKTHKVLFKRNLQIDKNAYPGRRIYVHIQRVEYQADVYVDGKLVESRANLTLPGKVDITDFLNDGTGHELAVGVTDYIVCLDPEGKIPPDGEHVGTGYIRPAPPLTRSHGVGMRYPPFIVIEPEVASKDIAIVTLCDKQKTIEVSCDIVNKTAANAKINAQVEVYHKGKLVKKLEEQTLTLPAGETTAAKWQGSWPDVILWSPENPHLYELRVIVSKNDKAIDINSERFGFKEYRIVGKRFYLNNKPFQPLGINNAWKGRWPQPAIKTTLIIDRIAPYRSIDLQAVLIADEIGYVCTFNIFAVDNADYGWKYHKWWDKRLYVNLKKSVVPKVKSVRNMPSIFAYSLANETPWYDKEAAKMMWDFIEYTMELDPTRFSYYSRQCNLHDMANVNAPHYFMHRRQTIYPIDTLWFPKSSDQRPDWVTQRFDARDTIQGRKYEYEGLRWDWWKKDIPLFETEGMLVLDRKARWESFLTWLYGDGVYVKRPDWRGKDSQAAINALDAFKGWARVIYRQMGMSAAVGQQGAQGGCNIIGDWGAEPLAIFAKDTNLRFTAGSNFKKTYTLFNSSEQTQDCLINYTLLDERGGVISSGATTTPVSVEPGDRKDFVLSCPLAISNSTGYADMYLNVYSKQSRKHSQFYRYTVFPIAQFKSDYKHTAVFDPEGSLTNVIDSIGIKVGKITSLTPDNLRDVWLLILGRDSITKASEQADLIKELVQGGMCVFSVRQDVIDSSILPVHVEDGYNHSTGAGAVISDSVHFLFEGLLSEDFTLLQNRTGIGCTFANAPTIPETSMGKPLLAVGHSQEFGRLDFAALLELKYGTGSYYLSQLYLIESLGYDPAVKQMFANLLNHFESEAPAGSDAKKLAIFANDNKIKDLIIRSNLAVATGEAKLDESKVVLINGDYDLSVIALSDLPQWIRSGGTAIFHQPSQSQLQYLKDQFGLDVATEPFPFAESYLIADSRIFDGLTSYNLQFDRSMKDIGRDVEQTEFDVGRERFLFKAAGADVSARSLTYPEYLGEVNVGQGRILLDNIRWDTVPKQAGPAFIYRVLNNLGVGYEKFYDNVGDPYTDYSFSPVDLAAYVNWSITDDADAGNGKGGWTDHGRNEDLRRLGVGKMQLRGVPIWISDAKPLDKSAIAYKGAVVSEPVDTGEIKINKKANAILFVHAATIKDGIGAEIAEIKVWYKERHQWIPGDPDPFQVIKVRNGTNICGWTQVGSVKSGRVVLQDATWAWTDSGRGGADQRGVIMFKWNNPNPEKYIDAIEVTRTGTDSQYYLLAISLGNKN